MTELSIGYTETVKVSPKFQIVIPRRVREILGIRAGKKVQLVVHRNRIEIIPVVPIKQMRGFLKGINTAVERERDRV